MGSVIDVRCHWLLESNDTQRDGPLQICCQSIYMSIYINVFLPVYQCLFIVKKRPNFRNPACLIWAICDLIYLKQTFSLVLLTKHWGDQIKENETGVVYGMYGKRERHGAFWWANMKA